MGIAAKETWVQVLVLTLTSLCHLGKVIFNNFGPQFFHLYNGLNNSTYHQGLVRRLIDSREINWSAKGSVNYSISFLTVIL